MNTREKLIDVLERKNAEFKKLLFIAHCYLYGVDDKVKRSEISSNLVENFSSLARDPEVKKLLKKIATENLISQKDTFKNLLTNFLRTESLLTARNYTTCLAAIFDMIESIRENPSKLNRVLNLKIDLSFITEELKNPSDKQVRKFVTVKDLEDDQVQQRAPNAAWKDLASWAISEDKICDQQTSHSQLFPTFILGGSTLLLAYAGLKMYSILLKLYISKIPNAKPEEYFDNLTLLDCTAYSSILMVEVAYVKYFWKQFTSMDVEIHKGSIAEKQAILEKSFDEFFNLKLIEYVDVESKEEKTTVNPEFTIKLSPTIALDKNKQQTDSSSQETTPQTQKKHRNKRVQVICATQKTQKSESESKKKSPNNDPRINEYETTQTHIIRHLYKNGTKLTLHLKRTALDEIPDALTRKQFRNAFTEGPIGITGKCIKFIGDNQVEVHIAHNDFRLFGEKKTNAEKNTFYDITKYARGVH